jgi:hypothetical protein
MILALGPPIELFYFLAVYAFAAGTFVGAVAVRFVCKWLPRIGNRSVRRNVVAIPHGGQALAIAVVPILVDLGGYSVCGTAQELLVHRLGGLASAAIVLAIGLCGFSAMAALIARLCPASVGTAVSVAACVHGIGIVVACTPLSILLPVPLALALVFSDVRRFLWGDTQRRATDGREHPRIQEDVAQGGHRPVMKNDRGNQGP